MARKQVPPGLSRDWKRGDYAMGRAASARSSLNESGLGSTRARASTFPGSTRLRVVKLPRVHVRELGPAETGLSSMISSTEPA
jgi:hypothetical protein